jgi:hypothetical protein
LEVYDMRLLQLLILLSLVACDRGNLGRSEALKALDSLNFTELRKAQHKLLSEGTNIVPELRMIIKDGRRLQAIAIATYLIGEVDSGVYLQELNETNRSLEVSCSLIRYPSQKGLNALSVEELTELSLIYSQRPYYPSNEEMLYQIQKTLENKRK